MALASDGKYKEAAAAAGRALRQTCAFKAAYLTDRNTSKDGIARLAGNKPQPVRTYAYTQRHHLTRHKQEELLCVLLTGLGRIGSEGQKGVTVLHA